MRLALLTNNRLPPREGVARHVLETGRRLAARGHEVTLVSRGEPGVAWRGSDLRERRVEGVRVLEYPDPPVPPPLHHLAARRALARWLLAGADGAETVHVHLPLLPPLPLPLPDTAALVVTVHSPMLTDSDAIAEPGLKPVLLRLHARLLSRGFEQRHLDRADRVVAVSRGVREELGACYRTHAAPVEVIPNGVDTGFFGFAPFRGRGRSLLYVGRLGYRKGLSRLLDAFALLAPRCDLELRLAGEGPLRERLARQARDLGIAGRVRFRGFLGREDLRAELQAAAAVVNPADYESGPLTLLEAMAAGAPVVSTPTGLAREFGARPPILLAPPEPAALAAAMLALLHDPAGAEVMARRARALVERSFDWERAVDRLEAVYGVRERLAA